MRNEALALGLALGLALAGCSGSSGSAGSSGTSAAPGCGAACVSQAFLSEDDVRRILAQAVGEAQARGTPGVVAVVDRAGNVLGVFAMTGAPATVATDGGRGIAGGLDGIPAGIVPAALAAIAKAVTGAYLSSEGQAFSTRTAGQIIQEHFNPNERRQPAGPLYGVQYSQLSCSDVNRNLAAGSVGPKRSPLGLAADPGGLPLYKDGVVVGGIGVESDGRYGIDRDLADIDTAPEESVALAGSAGFAAPADRRAERITADGRTLRYVDNEALVSNPASPPAFAGLPGSVIAVDGYSGATIRPGTAFGTAASGIRPAAGVLAARGAFVLVDAADAPRFAPRASADGFIAARDVEVLLDEALQVAARARAQIRRPLGSAAEATVTVVGTNGDILGLARTRDAPVFGIDVSAQKARAALFFSHPLAAAELAAAPATGYLVGPGRFVFSPVATYVEALRAFLGEPAMLTGATAWSTRALGGVHRPFMPDGIDEAPHGPLSKPYAQWSVFNVGLQLDLVNNQVVKGILGDTSEGCAGRVSAGDTSGAPDTGIARARNGIQVFPGGVPIYRGAQLAGAIGVSGDGVDQDDMIAFLGVARAASVLGNGLGHAPAAMRADTLAPQGTRLRYVQCPQAPFNDSSEQNVCAGL